MDATAVKPERPGIEPFPRSTDYFSALGLPRKLAIDLQDLERRYYELSRRFHPDFFQTAPPRERLTSLENSALVNKAYRTLRDPLARAEYLVKLERGAGTEIQTEAPRALFEEILELNELLSDYKLGDSAERLALRSQLVEKDHELRAEFEALEQHLTNDLFPRWDATVDSGAIGEAEKHPLLSEISRIIGNRAYLRRVLTSLEEALSDNP